MGIMRMLSQEVAIFIFSAAILLFWLIRALIMLWRLKRDPVLSAVPGQLASAPLVSIILPVRNEENNIEECIRSLRGQSYPNWEMIVIDDRSSDRTAGIVRALQEEDHRIRLISNQEEPPADWSGQVYANVRGAREARGEWLVFTDADTRHQPVHLNSALTYCRQNGVELLTAFPAMECINRCEKVIQPFIFWLFWDYHPPAAVNREGSKRAGASGTFFLVKKETYERMGGWKTVHDCIPDDLAFMERAKELGVPAHIVIATSTLKARLYPTLKASVEGWSRYMLSGANNNIFVAVLGIFYLVFFNILPFAFPLFIPSYPCSALLLGLSSLLILFIRFRINRLFRVPGIWALTHVIASGWLVLIFLNALYRRICGKGVSWKGRIYLETSRSIFWTGKRYRSKKCQRTR